MMLSATDQGDGEGLLDHLSLDVAASIENLHIVRLLISAFGTAHGADVDDLEDLRIATDEICAHLVSGAATGARLLVRVSAVQDPDTGSPRVELQALVEGTAPAGDLDELSTLILGAATDASGLQQTPGSSTGWFSRGIGSEHPPAGDGH